MKKYAWYFLILITIGCSSGTDGDEQSSDKIDYSTVFHFAPQHGTKNQPVSLRKREKEYYLFYTTGSDQWGYAKSSNLIDWIITSSLDMPKNSNGDVIYDSFNSAEMPSGPAWFIFYSSHDGIKRKHSGDGEEWAQSDINIPSEVNGTPKVTWYEPTESWIMVATGERKISILTSSNLLDWQVVSVIDDTNSSKYAQLIPLEDKWILTRVGKSSTYEVGTFDGSVFQAESDLRPLDQNKTYFRALLSNEEDRLLLLARLANNSFSSIREVRLINEEDDSKRLSAFPIAEFKSKMTSKRRGKLSKLRGDKSTWVSFPIDSISNSFEMLISNEIPELISIRWNKASGEMTIDKSSDGSNSNEALSTYVYQTDTDQLQVDLLIDYQSIELFLNEGDFQLTTTVNPSTIYKKVDIKVDGKTYDARSIFYGFISIN